MVGDFVGIAKRTVWSIVHRVAAAIARLRENYIKFPASREEIRQAQADFFVTSGFPGAVGCIDCEHFRIRSYGEKI